MGGTITAIEITLLDLLSQPRVWPSSLMAAAIQPEAKLEPIGHVISFMANWPPWVFYGIHAIPPSKGHFMASGHILPSWAFLANSHFTNPQAFIFDFGPWGSFCLLGASRPPGHHPCIQGHPFHYWTFGLNGLFGPFRPPTVPTVRRPFRPLLA
ncbi:hypothetical protein O181_076470 [Austropuccinia psidii MF-1]|uniref:Uncharacterized protein n=1 Tax=Austropuccinia psidii MF-1 TaxID=1389203 RepID=A0A9Q3IF16_9BASI|nr:hypothetical protein [Austropuccinia psidii MF-1]